MNLCVLVFLMIILPNVSNAQQFRYGTVSGILDSAWLDPINLAENPAAASNASQVQCSVFAGRYKDVQGLGFLSAGFATPFKKLAVGLVVHHTGTTGFQQNEFNLLLSKNLGVISLGIAIAPKFISVQSIGAYSSMSVGLGITRSSGPLTLGISVSGMALRKQEGNSAGFRQIKVSSQCLFKASEYVSVGVVASKQTVQPVSIQPTIFYNVRAFSFSMGFDTMAGSFFFLTGWRFKDCEVKMLLGYQAILGLANGVELHYKKER